MRHPSRHVLPRVKTFDECHLVRLLPVLEVPLVVRIWSDRQRLAATIRVDEADRDKVRVRDGGGGGDPEGVFVDGADGAPDLFHLLSDMLTERGG